MKIAPVNYQSQFVAKSKYQQNQNVGFSGSKDGILNALAKDEANIKVILKQKKSLEGELKKYLSRLEEKKSYMDMLRKHENVDECVSACEELINTVKGALGLK